MQIGELNRKIIILHRIKTNGPFGVKEEWEPIKTAWANVKYASDGEQFRAGSIGRKLTMRFVIRTPKTDLDNTFRIRFDGKDHAIDGVKPLGGDSRFFTEISAGMI